MGRFCFPKIIFYDQYQKGDLISKTPFSKVHICNNTSETQNTDELVVKIQKPFINKNNIKNEIKILKLLSESKYTPQLVYDEYHYLHCFLVFKKIPGNTLLEYSKNQSTQGIQPYIKEQCIHQLLEGFKYLQKHRIIHRDIKNDNIMIRVDGEDVLLKIIDFGLSRYQQNLKDFTTNEICGAYPYMCPEMLSNRYYNGNCDTWSLGVLIYFIFTQKYPYKIDLKNIKNHMLFHTPPEQIILNWNPKISKNSRVEALLRKMLLFDSDKRPLISELTY